MRLPSNDALDVPCTKADLQQAWKDCEARPVSISGGRTFQFDERSRMRMEEAILLLDGTSNTIDWILEDNTTNNLDHTGLVAVYDELRAAAAIRGSGLFLQYTTYKAQIGTLTKRTIADWVTSI